MPKARGADVEEQLLDMEENAWEPDSGSYDYDEWEGPSDGSFFPVHISVAYLLEGRVIDCVTALVTPGWWTQDMGVEDLFDDAYLEIDDFE